jgi:hypothetical protein
MLFPDHCRSGLLLRDLVLVFTLCVSLFCVCCFVYFCLWFVLWVDLVVEGVVSG